ncbi:phage GP46 family protein [Burkholderia seminalis]|uniref:phage GP46 family protein n=1 Tax=Burkholderia seminalis TaxID=488731 RepID=UPI00145379AD|nr:phage GP46 family protein [Burkholderia seminalis]MCA8430029.1 phage GP46 family protein [Burkholderia seminalis]VWB15821.1 tail protein [Burkholderia seminalis]
MPDITLSWDAATNYADWVLAGADLATGSDLQSAVLISIFTDREASVDDVIPDGSADRRGWWADDEIPIGSRMWLLKRAKQTTQTAQRAYDYLAEALQWLIDDGVAGRIEITTQWVRRGVLGARIVVIKNGVVPLDGQYVWVWEGIN